MRTTNDWLDIEYPLPRFRFDRANINLKIKTVMHHLDKCLEQTPDPIMVLDLGCGSGAYAAELSQRRFESVAIDISREEVVKARLFQSDFPRKIDYIVGDATDPPLKDETFDVVICSEVLEHLNAPGKCVASVRRLLKKDGIALITVPWLWDISSNTKQAIGNRMLDGIAANRKGLLAKLFFKHIGETNEDLVFRRYIPTRYGIYSETLKTEIPFGDYVVAHLNRNLPHLGHKHWNTPREWNLIIEANGMKVVQWQGNGKIVSHFAADRLDRIYGRILPRGLTGWLSQIVMMTAVKA